MVAALLLLGGGGYVVYGMTRGLRNNNPLNIEDDNVTAWEGLDTPRNDGGPGVPKLRFTAPEYGYRAGAHIINSYVTADGIQPTINGLITRWSATDQAAYIAHVVRDLGVDPNAPLDLTSALAPLFASMTSMENGINPYDISTIVNGINLA